MSYKIELTDNFKKEAKKLIKKYTSLRTEIAFASRYKPEKPPKKDVLFLGGFVFKPCLV